MPWPKFIAFMEVVSLRPRSYCSPSRIRKVVPCGPAPMWSMLHASFVPAGWVESGMSGAQALAEVGLSEGLHDATLDDALRIGGLRARYVDPFVAQVPANGKPNGGWRKRWGL
jgi:hypothetical protein